ncbi:hypothetical protein [Pandoraea communis]|uniref:hypothetical protein n=1 Tax=Pandoraea communis TaxID=2508297 RepID=UPI0025A6865A|nr:hypothetical protein [Pandoraea communis]MDM8355705.1 hypothetical protein [Pandoraea communis]
MNSNTSLKNLEVNEDSSLLRQLAGADFVEVARVQAALQHGNLNGIGDAGMSQVKEKLNLR